MTKLQFKILYREFLFRMIDRELLSAGAQGDANKLLGRFAAILIWVSIPFAGMALGLDARNQSRDAAMMSACGPEHVLIATTMLVVGLFAVLSWDSAFPDRRDVLILTPLPVRPRTIFLAKAASLAAALSVAVVTFNGLPGLALPLALCPPGAGLLDIVFSLDFYRPLVAYWVTMFAAGSFILCCVLCVQGLAAQLPRAIFLRVSAFLQMAALCLFVGVYFLQPSLITSRALTDPSNQRALGWLPSYWFLGLFQQLNGFPNGAVRPVLSALAGRAWAGLMLAGTGAAGAFLLAYLRTLRKIVEEPDIAPGANRSAWLPPFGDALNTAVVQFSIRTLLRSRHHRVILSFYAGAGFAVLILFMKTPLAKTLSSASAGVPLIATTFVMMCCWMVGIRVVFAMPLELRANWIFRVTPLRAAQTLAASRRAMYVMAAAPPWGGSAALFLWLWPWRSAVGHLVILGLVAITLVELSLHGFQKIPFTCSYLPGKSNLLITLYLSLMLGLNAIYWGAYFEYRALADPRQYAWIAATLAIAALCARQRTKVHSDSAVLRFEEEMTPEVMSLWLHRDGVLPITGPDAQA